MDPGPAHKRRRPAVACTECRRRKIKCDRGRPCGPCSKPTPSLRCLYHNSTRGNGRGGKTHEDGNIASEMVVSVDSHNGRCDGLLGPQESWPQPTQPQQSLPSALKGGPFNTTSQGLVLPSYTVADGFFSGVGYLTTEMGGTTAGAGASHDTAGTGPPDSVVADAAFLGVPLVPMSIAGPPYLETGAREPVILSESPGWPDLSSYGTRASSLWSMAWPPVSLDARILGAEDEADRVLGTSNGRWTTEQVVCWQPEPETPWYDSFRRGGYLLARLRLMATYSRDENNGPAVPSGQTATESNPVMSKFQPLDQAVAMLGADELRVSGTWTATAAAELLRLPVPTSIVDYAREQLTPRSRCDVLVEAYLQSFETVLRILHMPCFLASYERFWENTSAPFQVLRSRHTQPAVAAGDMEAFACKLLVVAAIGTSVQTDVGGDRANRGSGRQLVRGSAGTWTARAKEWLADRLVKAESEFRADLDLCQGLCLVSLARLALPKDQQPRAGDGAARADCVPGGPDLVGLGVRMGLHREPRIRFPGMSQREAEVWRRLWATMLELSLQQCLDEGLAAPVAPESYDCEAPGSMADERLQTLPGSDVGGVEAPPPRVAQLLAQTQRLRLRILDVIHAPGASKAYDERCRLATELANTHRQQTGLLHSLLPDTTEFAYRLLALFTLPFVLALHRSVENETATTPASYDSRRVRMEVSVELLRKNTPLSNPEVSGSPTVSLGFDQTGNKPSSTALLTGETSAVFVDELAPARGVAASEAGNWRSAPNRYSAFLVSCQGRLAATRRRVAATLCVDLIRELDEWCFPLGYRTPIPQSFVRAVREAVAVLEARVLSATSRTSMTTAARELMLFSCAHAYITAVARQRDETGGVHPVDVDCAVAHAASVANGLWRRALALRQVPLEGDLAVGDTTAAASGNRAEPGIGSAERGCCFWPPGRGPDNGLEQGFSRQDGEPALGPGQGLPFFTYGIQAVETKDGRIFVRVEEKVPHQAQKTAPCCFSTAVDHGLKAPPVGDLLTPTPWSVTVLLDEPQYATTMRSAVALSVFSALLGADSTQAKSLWSSKPATFGPQSSDDYILKTGYPVGNGKLGAIPFGPPGAEKMVLNVDSLWAGGPFQSSDYTGGNPSSPKYPALAGIREFIFQNGTGNVTALLGSGDYYGSYQTLGNLSTAIEGVSDFADYRRSLDLTTGIHATSFRSGGTHFSTTLFCSYPDQVCVYRIAADAALPTVAVHFENDLLSADLVNRTCNDNDDGSASLEGITQAGPPEGMKFRATVRVAGGHVGSSSCSDGRLVVPSDETRRSVTFVIGAGTDYDQKHGNAASRYSFKGRDPRAYVEGTTSAAASRSYETLESRHVDDYRSLQGRFTLQLPDPHNSSATETAALFSRYRSADAGDPFLEGLLFELSRHLLVSSSRENSLPANLQGRWTEQLDPAWSSDYHANINLQMNYWIANPLGLAHTQQALWAYMADTWAPRGAETARLLYGAPGWVTHNEMNIFGHTSMKDGAVWANYPAAPAWMMQHVWDNYEYTQDADWYRAQGYPLLRGVAEFWLAQLQDDGFSRDGSLVVNP
ncbi:hypothetical protein VTK73DRAFT_7114 [Phialemonium thermophilum]|uniref:Zn(2)-C6 fungal-type domain-containing protein n=1 Tax=Phialemonium thermophilum TaxID=223376 RepID=A0ABR3WGN5_9PEZI